VSITSDGYANLLLLGIPQDPQSIRLFPDGPLVEEQISEKVNRRILSGDQGMVVWWSFGAGVHVEPHSHPNEQIVWMLKGKMEFRLGSEQRICGQGDVVVIPGGTEHEAWFREDAELIDFFAPPRDDFLLGGKPTYMSES
jgi:quercetin dioxygenase-like cupin family protein